MDLLRVGFAASVLAIAYPTSAFAQDWRPLASQTNPQTVWSIDNNSVVRDGRVSRFWIRMVYFHEALENGRFESWDLYEVDCSREVFRILGNVVPRDGKADIETDRVNRDDPWRMVRPDHKVVHAAIDQICVS